MYNEGGEKPTSINQDSALRASGMGNIPKYLYSSNFSVVMAWMLTLDWLGRVMAVTGGSSLGPGPSSGDRGTQLSCSEGPQAAATTPL